jgi:hypothetical protein
MGTHSLPSLPSSPLILEIIKTCRNVQNEGKLLPIVEIQKSGIIHPFPSSPPRQLIMSFPHEAGQ